MSSLESNMKRRYSGSDRQSSFKRARRTSMQAERANAYYSGMPRFRPRVPQTGNVRTVGAYRRSIPGSTEKKFLETNIGTSANFSAGLVFNSLNLIPQGTTDITRIGNKVTITDINIRLILNMDDTTTAGFTKGIFRMIVFIDKQCNGATAGVADLLDGGVLGAGVYSFRELDQVDRFTILKDKVYNLPQVTANPLHTSLTDHYIKWGKKCSVPIHFSAATGAITEIKSNNLGVLFISNNTAVNVAVGLCRVKFTDL